MLLAGSALMFAAMVIVGVIVAKFRHDWEHHAVAGKHLYHTQRLLTKLSRNVLTISIIGWAAVGMSRIPAT